MAMDYLGALGAFVLAAETRSFTAAGSKLGISSSAVGKAVARLEQDLNVRLFHRSTRSITLTAEGYLFLERCQRILAEFEAAKGELSQASIVPQGKLRVSLPQIGLYLMPEISAFQQMFPRIELDLSFGDRLVNVVEEGFDAVLRIGAVNDSRLSMRQLRSYPHLLVASPTYLARYGTPEHPCELHQHVCLRYRFPNSGKLLPWPLLEQGQPVSIELPESAIANDSAALHAMAEAGVGIALLPEIVVADALAAGRLVHLLHEEVIDQRNVYLLWPSRRQLQPKLRVFIDFIAERLGASN